MVIRHLRSYLNKLYYFEGRVKDTSLFDVFTKIDLSIIKDELRGICEIIQSSKDYNEIRIKYPVRYCYLGSYVFLSL